MATAAYHPDPPACSSPLAVLFDARAYIGDLPNHSTTAQEHTSNKKCIRVSICPACPPAPSRLFVHCPNLDPDVFFEDPRIICTADCFLLLRIQICGATVAYPKDRGDYFIYRAGQRPSLQLLPKPPSFHDDQVGLLPRGGELFTVAALKIGMEGFKLHLFHSESGAWTVFRKVPVVTVERHFPFQQLPRNAARLNEHITTTVVNLGGKCGTMGWVDLWSGILLCDVLTGSPVLHDVPLPLPQALIKRGKTVEGCPKPHRGIAVVQGCVKMVELEVYGERFPTHDPESGLINFRIDDWELTQYTNSSPKVAWGDWKVEHTVKASSIDIDPAVHSRFLQYGLLEETPQGRKLQNLHTYQPALSLDDKGAVYLLTKTKFMQDNAWVLSVDIQCNKIQALSEFGIDRNMGLSLAYCPSTISRHIKSQAPPVSGGRPRCLMRETVQADDREYSEA